MTLYEIPAKTFLLGEYAAITGESALLLTMTPCFTLKLSPQPITPSLIHPDSPAGKWWQRYGDNQGLEWIDPYNSLGGLGASSAQFIAVYFAHNQFKTTPVNNTGLLTAYFKYSWSGQGLKPSGYDVLAQLQPPGMVFINRNHQQLFNHTWPFTDLSYILLHTGKKLATHEYLATSTLPNNIAQLSTAAEQGLQAINTENNELFIKAINDCYQSLLSVHLVAPHTIEIINSLKINPDILAAKGCGAMGADIVFLVVKSTHLDKVVAELRSQGHNLVSYYKKT